MASRRSQPLPSGRRTIVSSKSTTPREPGGFRGAHGMTCFCPESAMAHHQRPCFGRRSHSRIAGFSPLLQLA